jgi:hypothetical protein
MNLFATKFPVPESQIPVNNSKEAEVAKKNNSVWEKNNMESKKFTS